jgi:SAM-dependent methyltransferase
VNGSAARSVAKKILWPARRFFDPRFAGLHASLEDAKRILAADANASNEAAIFTGRSLDTIQGQLEMLNRYVGFDPDSPHSVDDIDERMARLLNYAASHEGFASQANLWFNPPLLVTYGPHNVALAWVNERVVEVPYAFQALCRVEPGAKVLDVGATESTVCLSLATLGYEVTAVDPRPNPLEHERLRTVVAHIEQWDEDVTFDAVVCLSTIEHVGAGDYGQDASERRVDLEAMKRMRELTRDGGLLVLTTAVGEAAADESGRTYDRAGFDELLDGWDVTDLRLVQRKDATTWATIQSPIEELASVAETVAMVTATKSAD